jgi:hypothetical protein
LFYPVKITCMQSNKASKKTSKNAPETSAPVAAAPATETAAPPRPARSSKSKSESAETSSAKRHRKSAVPVTEEVKPAVIASAPVAAIEPVAPPTGTPSAAAIDNRPEAEEPAYEQIAALAHALWLQRGCEHGDHEEDWRRAEQHLKAATAAS